MKDLSLVVTVEEGNLILSALGRLPFVKVYALIAKIQQQARGQIERAPRDLTPQVPPHTNAAEESQHVEQ